MRAILVGFLLLFPVSYATTNAAVSHIFSLLTAPMSALILLLLINVPLRRFARRLSFSQTDLIIIFAITSIASSASSENAWVTFPAIHLFPQIAETNNLAREYFLVHMPDWLSIKELDDVRDMMGGGRDFAHTVSKLPLFFPKYLAWGGLFVAVFGACVFINSLMRDAWCRQERLSFPTIQLPVAMCEGGGSGGMWRSRHTWIAFGAMFSIQILNGLNYLYPNLPSIPVKEYVDLSMLFKEPPFSNIGQTPIALYPFMSALGLFMPNDLLFSLIFFFIARKVAHVVIASYGIPQSTFSGTFVIPGPPYFDEQTWGGVLAMFLTALWISRGYLKGVWHDIRTNAVARDGGLRHRYALVGLIFCFGLFLFYGIAGTLPIPYLLIYFSLFLIFSVVLTRIRAQLGPPTHEFAFFGPNSIMHRFMGNQWLTDKQMVWVNQVFLTMNRIYRAHPMPYQLEAMKMGFLERVNQRKILYLIFGALIVGFLAGQFFLHVASYRRGGAGWSDGLWYLGTMMGNRRGPDIIGIAMTLVGFGTVVVLDAIRFRFPAFPLHPAGYVLSMNFGVDYYWFGLLIALLVKSFVQRYYGLKGYERLRNVALGILVGEYAAETIWMTMALVTQQSMYTISFNDRGLGLQ
ncbi:MAG: DUF6785 family protein [Fimbriimonadaceae bacterium]